MTVSIGVASLETHRELSQTSAVELLRTADRRLYASKQARKDRVAST
jgi:GGDEF domain-containing protein